MNIKAMLLEGIAHTISEGNTFERIKASVERIEDRLGSDASGSEKKAAVLDELQVIGVTVGGWFLNLLIELAVAVVKLQLGKLPKV